MSDGGEENNESKRAGSDNYSRAVSRVAVAQICENVGFQSSHSLALESLSDIAIRYIRDLGKAANFHANLAGRAECNVFDVIQGLEELVLSQGFPSAANVGQCIVGSGVVGEIIQYMGSAEEIPFRQPIPQFPISGVAKGTPTFVQIGEIPSSKHIPDWLPAFPDPHTYIHTPVWKERASDPRSDKIEQARQQRKAERSLLSLQHRLASNGSVAPRALVDPIDATKGDPENPFLAMPLQAGDGDVSLVVSPAKLSNDVKVLRNHVSVVDAFAPAIEAVRSKFRDSEDDERRVLPDKRPAVHFKLRSSKKFIGESVDLSLQKKGVDKTGSWVRQDGDKDDKQRRAELILRLSMENQQELTQL